MLGWLALTAVLPSILAFAQTDGVAIKSDTGPIFGSDIAVLALPCPGIPITMEQIEERVRRLDDGTSVVDLIKSKVYRDSSGRLRIDAEAQYAERPSLHYSQVIDPVTGRRYLLLEVAKIAYSMPGPKSGEAKLAFFGTAATEASSRASTTTDKTGKKSIEGFDFEGSRIVQTANAEPNPRRTVETWYSDELKLMGSFVESAPNLSHTVQVRNLRRQEPDANLFMVPADYKIQVVTLPLSD
jgi:hypothetical protein